ncbi:hypothetical protein GQ53DRAFT_744848 [Thozetella sp. PMI_491]|nr:hypothetical protein GQ53DRAFT_744848 [Thozetella sp. PMI_491]
MKPDRIANFGMIARPACWLLSSITSTVLATKGCLTGNKQRDPSNPYMWPKGQGSVPIGEVGWSPPKKSQKFRLFGADWRLSRASNGFKVRKPRGLTSKADPPAY